MANLPEQKTWIDGIYQLETSDPVVGGPGGISNRQAEQLASRTTYLKSEQEKTGSDLATHVGAVDPHTQYAPKASPALTGTPTAPTAAQTANSNQIATTAFVKAAITTLINGSPAALDTLQELANALGNDPDFRTTVLNAIADAKADATNKLNAHASTLDAHPQYAPKASPAFTGTPTAPTAATGSNDTQLATTAFVKAAVAALVNGSPAALDTLQELASALGNDPSFSTTVLNALAGKLAKDQNGADIPDKSQFRVNVGLENVVTSDTAQTITAAKTFKQNWESLAVMTEGVGEPGYLIGKDYDGSARWTLGYQDVATDRLTIKNNKTGSAINFEESGAVGVFTPASQQFTINGAAVYHNGNLTPAAIGAMPTSELAGIPLPFPGAVAPTGWLKCNGQAFEKSLYPVLASRYPSGVLPDLRGEFVRGWDDGRGVDVGRALMSAQGDAIRNIVGSLFYGYDADVPVLNTNSSSGALYYEMSTKMRDTESLLTLGVDAAANNWYPAKLDASRVVPTASENRPRNIVFNYIVRAA